jgi:trans-aconitate 2-methyltransferase
LTWQPERYLAFADQRTRAALDLLARVPLADSVRVADLGCGPGNSTALLAERWPGAAIIGVDSSPEMLAEARASGVRATWVEADIGAWTPDRPFDLIFANASLHLLEEHAALLPGLLDRLRAGGVLAVQMPRNFEAPSHVLLRETARTGPWAERLAADPVLSWTRGTVLRPVMQALDAAQYAAFETAYTASLRAAYPRRPDGRTLFPFRRLFIVARRP